MINHKYKIIFIHIPKTGGVSVEKFFNQMLNLNQGKHDQISKIKIEKPVEYNKYLKFTIVRHPYNRMLSYYNYLRTWNQTIKPFKEWVLNMDGEPEFLFEPMVNWIDSTVEVLKLENIRDDFTELLNKIKLEGQLPHSNKSNKIVNQTHLTKEIKSFLFEKYKNDFEKFNYKY